MQNEGDISQVGRKPVNMSYGGGRDGQSVASELPLCREGAEVEPDIGTLGLGVQREGAGVGTQVLGEPGGARHQDPGSGPRFLGQWELRPDTSAGPQWGCDGAAGRGRAGAELGAGA